MSVALPFAERARFPTSLMRSLLVLAVGLVVSPSVAEAPDASEAPTDDPLPASAGAEAPSVVQGPATAPSADPPGVVLTPAAAALAAPSGVPVPASIDATGTSDASTGLGAFLRSVPDGSTVVFAAGGIYRMDTGLHLYDRHDLVFEGQGATLRANGSSTEVADSLFLIEGGSNIAIRNFTLEGNNDKTGSALYGGGEFQMGVAIYGASGVEVGNTTIRKTWGDGVYVGPGPSGSWSDTVWIHDNALRSIGRMAFTLNAGRNWTIENNTIDQVGMSVFMIEPDLAWEGATDGAFRHNTVGAYGLTDQFSNWLVAANNDRVALGATIRNIAIADNLVTTGMAVHPNNPNGGGLNIIVRKSRTSNISVTNNRSRAPFGGGTNLAETPMYFANVDGLRVTGNVQPTLQSRPLATISSSTGVTYP
jgi:hypothetical protein